MADEQEDVPVDTDRWLRLATSVLVAEGVDADVEMSLLFVDEAAIASLNERFMGKAAPTDVLSFPIDEDVVVSGRSPDNGGTGPVDDDEIDEDDVPMILGDVVVCPAVAARNASEHAGAHHDGSLDDELALLVVHGILHLLGLDHEDDTEAEAMEARERALLQQFHRPSPANGHNGDGHGQDHDRADLGAEAPSGASVEAGPEGDPFDAGFGPGSEDDFEDGFEDAFEDEFEDAFEDAFEDEGFGDADRPADAADAAPPAASSAGEHPPAAPDPGADGARH